MKKALTLLLAALLILSFAGCAMPTALTSTVIGSILDNAGNAISEATIEIVTGDMEKLEDKSMAEVVKKATTAEDGSFKITGLEAGAYYYTITPKSDSVSFLYTPVRFEVDPEPSEKSYNIDGDVYTYDLGKLEVIPCTATISGTTLAKGNGYESVVFPEDTVLYIDYPLTSDYYSEIKTYTATVADDGTFAFSGIPSGFDVIDSNSNVCKIYTYNTNGNKLYGIPEADNTTTSIITADGTTTALGTVTFSYTALTVKSKNISDDAIDFVVSDSIVLTFNNKILSVYDVSLSSTAGEVDVTTSISENVVTIDPASDLAARTFYTLELKAYDGGSESNLTATYSNEIKFTTAHSDTLTVPTLAFYGSSTYDSGATINLKFDYNPAYSYKVEASFDGTNWNDSAALTPATSADGKTAYTSVTPLHSSSPLIKWQSGDTVSIRLKASIITRSYSGAGEEMSSVYSNTLTVTDTVAPTSVDLNTSTQTGGSSTVNITMVENIAPTATSDGLYYFTVSDLDARNEKLGTVTVNIPSTSANYFSGSSVIYNSDYTAATVYMTVAKGNTRTITRLDITLTVQDNAGNTFDSDSTTTAAESFTLKVL